MISDSSRKYAYLVFSILLSTFVIMLSAPPAAAQTFGGGSGTPEDPYIIENVEQLQAMKDNLSAHYALGNDIDASDTVNWNGGAGFEPVGTDDNPFTGDLDGCG
ncbi:MAG TPA: hypothetical protein ENF64_00165, partial [Hadesarchaea archaeon]|nr:hypothetical protein [Hadesarchaea archaeon]